MASGLAVLATALCVSLIEGLWAWLLASAVAEVAGQQHPSLGFVGFVLFAAWLGSRVTGLAGMPVDRRRWLLAGGGAALALAAGTIQSGLLLPLQLLFGHYEPDLRGAGIVLLLMVTYLWARGLALANGTSRERVIGHIAVASSALAAVLVFLPLTTAVRTLGFSTVVAGFALSVAALLLTQAIGVESRELTPTRWGLIAGGLIIVLLLGGAAGTGALSSGILSGAAGLLRAWGRWMSPVTDAILLALGHVAEALVLSFRWLAQMFGANPEDLLQNMRSAEESRPKVEDQTQQAAPEVLGVLVAVVLTILFGIVMIWLFRRLVRRSRAAGADDVEEVRTSAPGQGRGSLVRGALDWLASRRGDGDDGRDARTAIRRHYRTLQLLMARSGLPRGPDQTPSEYERALASSVPWASEDLWRITEAYVHARYADATTALPAPDEVEQSVLRVRAGLANGSSAGRGR